MLINPQTPFSNYHNDHTKKYTSLWDTVKGPPPDLKGKTPFFPTVVLLRHSGFYPLFPLPGRGVPPAEW